jgi:hypothetical protein
VILLSSNLLSSLFSTADSNFEKFVWLEFDLQSKTVCPARRISLRRSHGMCFAA